MTRLPRLVAAGLLALQAGCVGDSFGGHEGGVTELLFLPGEPTRLAVHWAIPPTGLKREDHSEWPGQPGPPPAGGQALAAAGRADRLLCVAGAVQTA